MTIEHAGPFLESALFSGARYSVFLVLCNYADDFGECWPSYEAVATAARCDRKTAIREVSWFAERGLVAVLQGDERPKDKRKIAGRSNVYRIHLRFIRVMFLMMRTLKEEIGRNPAKRYGAVRRASQWAERMIDEEGVEALVAAAADVIARNGAIAMFAGEAGKPQVSEGGEGGEEGNKSSPEAPEKGGATPLLPSGNSGATPPFEPPKRDICGVKGGATPPYPSIEPPEEPPTGARARASSPEGSPAPAAGCDAAGGEGEVGEPAAAGAAGHREKRPITERERLISLEVNFILDWLLERPPMPLLFRELSIPPTADDAEIEAAALDRSPRALRQAQGWVRWAESCLAGDPAVKAPIAPVKTLMAALDDRAQRIMMARRLSILRGLSFENQEHSDADEGAAAEEPGERMAEAQE